MLFKMISLYKQKNGKETHKLTQKLSLVIKIILVKSQSKTLDNKLINKAKSYLLNKNQDLIWIWFP